MLIALTTASRAIGIHHLTIKHMGRLHNHYVFTYDKLHKGWRRGQSPPVVRLFAYSQDPELCVVKCLNEYIRRSEKWRTDTKNQLLLSYISPHKEVTSSTISNWIKETLKFSGATTLGEFGEHSTR